MNDIMTDPRLTSDTTEIIESGSPRDVKYAKSATHMNMEISGMAQLSFLMVLVPILGETFLEVVRGEFGASSVGALPLILGFVSAFLSGLFACKVMIALVNKAKLSWFALYCLVASACIFIFA